MSEYLEQSEIQKVYKTNIVPRNLSQTGYGNKIATQYKIKIGGRLHRVYCRIYSNSGTCYIIKNGIELGTYYIDDALFDAAIVIDGRYTIDEEYCGYHGSRFVVRFLNEFVGVFEKYEEAEIAMTEHYNNRFD